jgi:hypothetical protein
MKTHTAANHMTTKAKAALFVACDSPDKLRTGDAWRVYDNALYLGVVREVKEILRKTNPAAFAAFCEYESEEIESKIKAES